MIVNRLYGGDDVDEACPVSASHRAMDSATTSVRISGRNDSAVATLVQRARRDSNP